MAIVPIVNENYGLNFAPDYPQVHRELFIYSYLRGHWGKEQQEKAPLDLSKFPVLKCHEHLINAIKLLWPEDVKFENNGYTNDNATDIVKAWCYNDDIGIAGNASSGKTRVVAACIVADWMAAPHCTTTIVGSTSREASEDRIWGHCAYLFKNASIGEEKVGALVEYKKIIVFEGFDEKDPDRDYINSIKMIAFESGNEGDKAIASTRGRKNERFRVILDEHAEMGMNVNNIKANLAANDDFMFVGIANPAPGNNPHKELCEPDDPRGYESVNKEMRTWKTRTGICLFLSGEKSPNFQVKDKNEKPPFPYLLTYRKLERILKDCYGNKNSLHYWRNAVGFWPASDVELTIMSKAFIAALKINQEPIWMDAKRRILAGFDPAFTSGGDRCAMSFGRIGMDESRRQILHYMGTKTYDADIGEVYEESVAKKVVADCMKMGVDPLDFGMDISGDGGKMLQAIIREWQLHNQNAINIKAISSMGRPTSRIVSEQDRRKCEDVYDRLVTEYWFTFYHALGCKVIWGLDVQEHQTLVDELCARQYTTKNKKTAVETKRDMKDRINKSPDYADSCIYLNCMALRAGLVLVSSEMAVKHTLESNGYRNIDGWIRGEKPNKEDHRYSYSGASTDPDGF